jgi:outer membrane protein TolC
VVPVDPEPGRSLDRSGRVARRAYELYEARGGVGGDELQDWLDAERQIDAEDGVTS